MFSLKTVIRNSEWKDTESLALSALYSNPSNAKVHFTLGNVLAQQVRRWGDIMSRIGEGEYNE